jgi:hypothetical protein
VLQNSEPTRTSVPIAATPGLLKFYVLVVMVLLPMDWFGPTGVLFKEFGAKPATVVLTLGGICGMAFVRGGRAARNSVEFIALVLFSAWLALGFLAALANFLVGWSDWHSDRSPFVQLVTQSALVVMCAIAVVGNVRLMALFPVATLAARYLPAAALVQLVIFGLNAADVLSNAAPPLSLFRASDHEGGRPTGLFSEPAMFGTFAALYGTALLCLPARHGWKLVHWVIAAALFASSLMIGAKTFVVVVGVQAAYFVLRRTRSLATGIAAVGVLIPVVACAVYFIQAYSTLDVRENLSSADRLGSALLASNVIAHGYALPGIGFGQFHFFYRDRFAPDFLFLSREASLQLTPNAPNRASTYNFFLRVLLETGLTGFIVLVMAIKKLWSVEVPPRLTFIPYIFAGSLGFLLTQDTYVYPPLMFSSALIMSVLESQRCAVAGAIRHNPTVA